MFIFFMPPFPICQFRHFVIELKNVHERLMNILGGQEESKQTFTKIWKWLNKLLKMKTNEPKIFCFFVFLTHFYILKIFLHFEFSFEFSGEFE